MMETGKFAQQVIGMHKTMFDNTFNGMVVLQNYSENMMDGFLRQFPWMTEENKKPFVESMAMMKKMRDEYKAAVDQGYAKLEEMVEKE